MSLFNEHGLTPKQEVFAVAVASGSNLSDAYRQAYPGSLKWKQEHVHVKASEMASSAKVARRIAALQSSAADVAILSAADILRETRRVALSSAHDFFWPDGRLKMPIELDADAAACVSSFEISPDGVVKYKLWDKNSSADRAARILGLFERDNDQQNAPLRDILASLGGRVVVPKKTPAGGSD